MGAKESRSAAWPLLRLGAGGRPDGRRHDRALLLLTDGVTPRALVLVVLTCGLTTARVLVFGKGSPNPPEHRS